MPAWPFVFYCLTVKIRTLDERLLLAQRGHLRDEPLRKGRRFAGYELATYLLFGSAHYVIAELTRIAEIGNSPAIQIVLGHALLGESLEFIGIA